MEASTRARPSLEIPQFAFRIPHCSCIIAPAMRTTFLLLLLAPAGAVAQEASPYVPLSWWGTPFVEHLIARGRLADPTPLTRPFRAADLLPTLDPVDSTIVTPAEWTDVQQIRAAFMASLSGPSTVLFTYARVTSSSPPRRDALRV